MPSIDHGTDWKERLAALLQEFPDSHALKIEAMGAPLDWESLELWRR